MTFTAVPLRQPPGEAGVVGERLEVAAVCGITVLRCVQGNINRVVGFVWVLSQVIKRGVGSSTQLDVIL